MASLLILVKKLFGWQLSKSFVLNISLLCISLTFILGISEVFVRIFYSDITTTADNSSYFAQRWKEQQPEQINSMGFREREINSPHPDTYRIVVIGDSFTYGQGVKKSQRVTDILEQQLNTSDIQYEVLNFGRPGAETRDHLEILKKHVLNINPDYILLQWFINDVEGSDYSDRPKFWRLLPSDYLNQYLHNHSALYFLVKQKWQNLQQLIGIVPDFSYTQYMVKRFKDLNNNDSQRARGELAAFIDLCKEKGIPVGIVAFPGFSNDLLTTYPLGFLLDRVSTLCKEKDIPCVDLRSAFSKVDHPSKLWVNKFDHHPNHLAYKISAEEIMKQFAQHWHPKKQ